MNKILKRRSIWLFFLILIGTAFIYKDVIFNNRIAFPANLLASFFSPWSTYKFENYPHGIPNKPIGGNDQIRLFYPWRTFINASIKNMEFPLWNPYNFSGSPLLANFQSAFFYPLNLIYLLIPLETAWSILVIIQPLLGTFFMFLFLKRQIDDDLSSFIGAFAFGFSGFILTWSQENGVVGHTAIWFPLVLLAVDLFTKEIKPKNFFLLVVSLSICILAGFLQIAFYIFLVSFCYGIYKLYIKRSKETIKRVVLFLSAFLTSFLLTAAQLLPSIEAFYLSTRSTSSVEPILDRYLLPLSHYIIVFAPDIFGNPGAYNFFGKGFYHETIFYIGIIPLVFAVAAILSRQKDPTVKFFSLVTIMSIFLGIKSPFTDWFFRLPIPIINTFTPSRIFFVASTSLAVLSSYGFYYWEKNNSSKLRKNILITVLIIGLILLGFISYHFFNIFYSNNLLVQTFNNLIGNPSTWLIKSLKISLRNLVIPLFILLSIIPAVYLKIKVDKVKYLLFLLVLLGQFYFLNKYVVISDKQFIYPNHFIFSDIQNNLKKTERFLSFGLPILGNVNLVKKTYSPDGIDPVFPRRYGQLIHAAKYNGEYTLNISRIEVNLSECSGTKGIFDFRRSKLMSLLGVKRIYDYVNLDPEDGFQANIFPKDMFDLVWEKDGWKAYENNQALPRAYLVDNYIVETDPQKNIDLVLSENLDLSKTVILEEEPGYKQIINNDENIKEKANGVVDIVDYQPLEIVLDVATDKDRILFLSDNYYPGWESNIDGQPTKILRANYSFRAIVVPEGKHIIKFKFNPVLFKNGLFISVIASVILILVLFSTKLTKLN